MTDRRQMPRVDVANVECRLDFRVRVRLLDISLNGALLAAEFALPVGAAAILRSGVGSGAFRSDVQVKRNFELPSGVPPHGLGAVFTTMDGQSRRSLEDFLRKASQ